jgi:hypothetical protein
VGRLDAWQGAVTWRRILDCIERIQAQKPADDEPVHWAAWAEPGLDVKTPGGGAAVRHAEAETILGGGEVP